MPPAPVRSRLARLDWQAAGASLLDRGHAVTPPVLTARECDALIRLYADDARFRSRIDMGPRRFGEGEYKYFAYPLPPIVQALRLHAWPPLARIANDWMRLLRRPDRYPPRLPAYLARCRRHGQSRPTPLLLRYETGGYNCLHQDLYGSLAFPLQITVLLNRPGADFTGGDFLLVEQRPRAQSRGESIALQRGAMVIFPNRDRPLRGARGCSRAAVRHGVATLTSGIRLTLGVIFHDAR